MNHDEFIATLVSEILMLDMSNPPKSAREIADKAWRMMHPLVWEEQVDLVVCNYTHITREQALSIAKQSIF